MTQEELEDFQFVHDVCLTESINEKRKEAQQGHLRRAAKVLKELIEEGQEELNPGLAMKKRIEGNQVKEWGRLVTLSEKMEGQAREKEIGKT